MIEMRWLIPLGFALLFVLALINLFLSAVWWVMEQLFSLLIHFASDPIVQFVFLVIFGIHAASVSSFLQSQAG